MKKVTMVLLMSFLMMNGQRIIAQNLFSVYDRFGTKHNIEDLNTSSARFATISGSCSSGYFTAYFVQGSIWDVNPAAQAVLCQVLGDISNFLGSPLSTNPGIGPKIRLYCTDTPTTNPNALGAASSFYVFPGNAGNPDQGILDNQVQKMIMSGVDSYSNVPALLVNGSYYYHGMVYANPTPPGGASWNTTLTNTNVTNSEFCMYSMLLHEFSHALGVASLISGTGASVFGAADNFYSRYDKFLYILVEFLF